MDPVVWQIGISANIPLSVVIQNQLQRNVSCQMEHCTRTFASTQEVCLCRPD